MIQRIQSVLLFLGFLLNGSIFFSALYSHAVEDPSGWMGIAFAIVLTAAALLLLICIFLYKNRQNQVRWINLSMLFQLMAVGFAVGILFSLGGLGTFLWDEALGLIILFTTLLLQLYARKKVKDDIELVKSMDRIR